MNLSKRIEMEEFLRDLNEKTLGSYGLRKSLLKEHCGIEESVLAGGYGYRQILELIQNGADAILEAHEDGFGGDGRIEVILTDSYLYVANTGAPLGKDGIDALLTSHNSPKRGNQIGRFGLGFKSLLRLGGAIDVISSTWGGIRFDPRRCRNEISQQFGVEEAPSLRLAWSIDESEISKDLCYVGLQWAETVVRISIEDAKLIAPLKEEILAFPSEFLLFSRIPIELNLDVGNLKPRILSVSGDGNIRKLTDGDKVSEWRLFEKEVQVTDAEVKSDATHIHSRDRVPLAWALPLTGRKEEAGRFWAFFPTKTSTYISGILNAPWKLNNDRQGLISGSWNEMLMGEAAGLVAESMLSLSDPGDPGKHLDAFPRRPDRNDVPAMPLLEELWRLLETAKLIPDCNGVFHQAAELTGHPTDEEKLLDMWMAAADQDVRAEFVHPSCLGRERHSRLQALSDRLKSLHGDDEPCCKRADWHEWLMMVSSPEQGLAADVLRISEQVRLSCKPDVWSEARPRLRIIPDVSGMLRKPGEVMLGPADKLPPGYFSIATHLLAESGSIDILKAVLEVAELDDDVWTESLQNALRKCNAWNGEDSDWEEFWRLLLMAPESVGLEYAALSRERILIKTRGGEWVKPFDALLPGRLASNDDAENRDILADIAAHGGSNKYLNALGVTDLPDSSRPQRIDMEHDSNAIEHFSDWLESARLTYKKEHQTSARNSYLLPRNLLFPTGWNLLSRLGGTPKAKLTAALMESLLTGKVPDVIYFGHATVNRYPSIRLRNPFDSWLLEAGTIQIGEYSVDLAAVVAESSGDWFRKIEVLMHSAPVFQRLRAAADEDTGSYEQRQQFWIAAIRTFVTRDNIAEAWLSEIWNRAALQGVYPSGFPGENGKIPLADVYITTSLELAERAREDSQLVFVLAPEALELWESKGARRLDEQLKPIWDEEGAGVAITEALPELAPLLSDEMQKNGKAVRVSGLRMQFNSVSTPCLCLQQGSTFYFDGERIDESSLYERYDALLKELHSAGSLRCSVEEALLMLIDTQVDQRRAAVADGGTLEKRLVMAVGKQRTPLLNVLGALGTQSFIARCQLDDLAHVVLRHLGPSTLTSLRETLEAEGLAPPARWGTADAREFAKSLGFPESFGSAQGSKREPEEWSQGPFPLPPLHDFQIEVRDGIEAMIRSNASGRRAVVSLPTGGGKTRVTVEAAVEFTLKPSTARRGVLWIAQTDELCEQAVQAFRQVWPNRGAEKTGLRILRLWGGNPTPAIPDEGEPFVIVASIQTFDARGGLSSGPWDRRLGMLVVDECHHAITPSYTRLFKWLGFDARTSDEGPNSDLVILGLSATPFRMDDDGSRRLAARFSNRWFPNEQEALHKRLLNQGVLCQVTSEELPSGTGLSSAEEAELGELGAFDGFEFERLLEKINQRLGDHGARNRLLVERIRDCSEQSILLFANSVSHSNEMAARLNLDGIPAASISGNTSRSARRYFLEQFQNGELRVLCNHSVLTTGFDAPRTDMLLIARQVFSPVRYMQMVGRGLRGVKNGGTERCRIVTVLDNLGRFQNRHPYHYCRSYFEYQTR